MSVRGTNPSTLLRKGCASRFLSIATAESGLSAAWTKALEKKLEDQAEQKRFDGAAQNHTGEIRCSESLAEKNCETTLFCR
jgi:hypothetical protein